MIHMTNQPQTPWKHSKVWIFVASITLNAPFAMPASVLMSLNLEGDCRNINFAVDAEDRIKFAAAIFRCIHVYPKDV